MTEQAARCVLKLNTPVLNALFPEGSEARVELISAALTEVTNTYVKSALSEHVQDYLKTLATKVKNESDIGGIVAKYFQTSGGWNSVASLKPDTQLTKALTAAIEKAFDAKFYALLEERIEAKVKDYTDKLDSRVEYAVKQRIDRLTTDAIQARVNAAVEAARAAL
jgi:uncharacterized membrane protein YheB (UPF0754 family)